MYGRRKNFKRRSFGKKRFSRGRGVHHARRAVVRLRRGGVRL